MTAMISPFLSRRNLSFFVYGPSNWQPYIPFLSSILFFPPIRLNFVLICNIYGSMRLVLVLRMKTGTFFKT